MLQADLLESISETRYLSADNYTVYRTIMRIFYLEHQKMHYQMDRDTVLVLLRGQTVFADYTPEQLTLDLQQLVKWKNLTPIQDPRKPRTIAEFKNKQYQYIKAAQRQKILEEERALRQEVMGYIRDGKLDLAALDAPVSPAVRTVFMSWVALANLSPDKRGQTQYGQSYRLKKRGDQTCQLRCTDGILTMPSCVLIFEEAGHV